MDSLEQTPNDMLDLEGSALDALKEAFATLEDQAPVRGSPNANQVLGEAPSEAAFDQVFLDKLAIASPRRVRMVDRMVLSSYVQPME